MHKQLLATRLTSPLSLRMASLCSWRTTYPLAWASFAATLMASMVEMPSRVYR